MRDKLHEHGVDKVKVLTQLAPAWTTDWVSPTGKAALRDYGIAPPTERAIDISALSVRRGALMGPRVGCPRCGSNRTQLISQFGSTPCKALYKCLACLEPFDYFKSH